METKESPYYYGNQNCPPTILEFKSHHAPISHIEMPWDASVEDVLQALYGAMVTATFEPASILNGMKKFVENNWCTLENNQEEHEIQ